MIGAMPAVAVRHERRKNKTKDKPVRPSRLQIQQMKAAGAVINDALSLGGGQASENGSHPGTPVHHIDGRFPNNGDLPVLPVTAAANAGNARYGDECFYGRVSLLHFIVFFLLGGLTVLIVGAVQFKPEAGLAYLRYHFIAAGTLLIAIGLLLLVIKCACYRIPLPDEDEEDEDELEKDDHDEKNKLSPPHVIGSHTPSLDCHLSPSKEGTTGCDATSVTSSSRRASRGDVVQHHLIVKTGDETRSLLTLKSENGKTLTTARSDVTSGTTITTMSRRGSDAV